MNSRALTTKDLRTAELLASGLSRKEIAQAEAVSLSSINSRVDALLFKTFSQKAIEAVHKLSKQGLIALTALTFTLASDIDSQRRARRSSLRVVRVIQRI